MATDFAGCKDGYGGNYKDYLPYPLCFHCPYQDQQNVYIQTCIVMMYIKNVSKFKGILFLLNSTPACRLLFTVYTVIKMVHWGGI